MTISKLIIFDILFNLYKFFWKPFNKKDFFFLIIISASSSSSSSESSSDEDDTATIDSREIGFIHYDENILPLGCDKELYDAAFVMREHRYNSEFQIRNEQKTIEGLRKDLGLENKRLKLLETELKISQDNLKIFMVDKTFNHHKHKYRNKNGNKLKQK